LWTMDPFGKIKPNIEFTIVWLLVSPKNTILCSKNWVKRECVIFYNVRVCHIYRWVSVSLLQFLKKKYKCVQMVYVCVVNYSNVMTCFMLHHIRMCCQLLQCPVTLYVNTHAFHNVLSTQTTIYHTCVLYFSCTN